MSSCSHFPLGLLQKIIQLTIQPLDDAHVEPDPLNVSFRWQISQKHGWSNVEVRNVITYVWNPPAEIHRQLVEVYGANVISRKEALVWCIQFDIGRTDVQTMRNDMVSKSTSTTDDNLCGIEDLIQDDRRVLL